MASMTNGVQARALRPGVVFDEDGGHTCISFAHWKVQFPSHVIKADESLQELMATRRVRNVPPEDRGILALLEAQGCFLPARPERLTARAVLRLFQPLRSELYAQYYSHPAWSRLRNGDASRGELTAWMIHNYHISRSAGVIAARMASTTPDGDLREFFREDALEEYWHCDAFYFVEQAGAMLPAADVKRYVPLPASTAFEDHALRVAEEDSLGHLLIAYFQESSIIFRQDSEQFYNAVESNYALPNAFAGWRKHMTLDLDHDHAGELEAQFDDEQIITMDAAAASIRAVQLAQFFLLQALDQIAAHAPLDDALTPRLPESFNEPRASERPEGRAWSRAEGVYLLHAVRDGAFRALALARTHDQIIASGRIASVLGVIAAEDAPPPSNPWLVASRNFVVERAAEPDLLLSLARVVIDAVGDRCSELRGLCAGLEPRKSPAQLDGMSEIAVKRLRELLDLASAGASIQPLPLVVG
jgi:hypothetical protein